MPNHYTSWFWSFGHRQNETAKQQENRNAMWMNENMWKKKNKQTNTKLVTEMTLNDHRINKPNFVRCFLVFWCRIECKTKKNNRAKRNKKWIEVKIMTKSELYKEMQANG